MGRNPSNQSSRVNFIDEPLKPSNSVVSPGPIYEPEAGTPDYWRLARALYAAGFRKGELVHNAFSYHLPEAPKSTVFVS